MARIKGRNTGPELTIEKLLQERGLEFDRCCGDVSGRPDFVFRDLSVAVFVDGDFWHGYRFSLWKHKLSAKWREKIALNRARDKKNFTALRRRGWKVVRIWEHQIERNPVRCADRVCAAIASRSTLTVHTSTRPERRPS
jgi:DNA mismatch endonuclease (patch repair protein)